MSGIIPILFVLPVSLGAEKGSTFSSFNNVTFNLLAVLKEATILEQLQGLCKINLSQALADGCCSAQAEHAVLTSPLEAKCRRLEAGYAMKIGMSCLPLGLSS